MERQCLSRGVTGSPREQFIVHHKGPTQSSAPHQTESVLQALAWRKRCCCCHNLELFSWSAVDTPSSVTLLCSKVAGGSNSRWRVMKGWKKRQSSETLPASSDTALKGRTASTSLLGWSVSFQTMPTRGFPGSLLRLASYFATPSTSEHSLEETKCNFGWHSNDLTPQVLLTNGKPAPPNSFSEDKWIVLPNQVKQDGTEGALLLQWHNGARGRRRLAAHECEHCFDSLQ